VDGQDHHANSRLGTRLGRRIGWQITALDAAGFSLARPTVLTLGRIEEAWAGVGRKMVWTYRDTGLMAPTVHMRWLVGFEQSDHQWKLKPLSNQSKPRGHGHAAAPGEKTHLSHSQCRRQNDSPLFREWSSLSTYPNKTSDRSASRS
jgi:hypothetical protein